MAEKPYIVADISLCCSPVRLYCTITRQPNSAVLQHDSCSLFFFFFFAKWHFNTCASFQSSRQENPLPEDWGLYSAIRHVRARHQSGKYSLVRVLKLVSIKQNSFSSLSWKSASQSLWLNAGRFLQYVHVHTTYLSSDLHIWRVELHARWLTIQWPQFRAVCQHLWEWNHWIFLRETFYAHFSVHRFILGYHYMFNCFSAQKHITFLMLYLVILAAKQKSKNAKNKPNQ